MLQSISWKEYLILVGSATVVYYSWWVIRYYHSLQWVRKELPVVNTQPVFLSTIAAGLAIELTKLINQSGEELMSENELTDRLRQLLGNEPYDKLKGSVFQEKIDALIARELEKYGSIRFDPEVIRGLWQNRSEGWGLFMHLKNL